MRVVSFPFWGRFSVFEKARALGASVATGNTRDPAATQSVGGSGASLRHSQAPPPSEHAPHIRCQLHTRPEYRAVSRYARHGVPASCHRPIAAQSAPMHGNRCRAGLMAPNGSPCQSAGHGFLTCGDAGCASCCCCCCWTFSAASGCGSFCRIVLHSDESMDGWRAVQAGARRGVRRINNRENGCKTGGGGSTRRSPTVLRTCTKLRVPTVLAPTPLFRSRGRAAPAPGGRR